MVKRSKKTFVKDIQKEDILWAKDTDNNSHPIVFLEKIDDASFRTCILSHSSKHGNIKMGASHFWVETNIPQEPTYCSCPIFRFQTCKND
jgi:hypothetical protein